jgi:hypothetical protein
VRIFIRAILSNVINLRRRGSRQNRLNTGQAFEHLAAFLSTPNPSPTIPHPNSYRKVYQKVAFCPPLYATLSVSLGKHDGAVRKIRHFRKYRKLQASQSPQSEGKELHKLQIAQVSLLSILSLFARRHLVWNFVGANLCVCPTRLGIRQAGISDKHDICGRKTRHFTTKLLPTRHFDLVP